MCEIDVEMVANYCEPFRKVPRNKKINRLDGGGGERGFNTADGAFTCVVQKRSSFWLFMQNVIKNFK